MNGDRVEEKKSEWKRRMEEERKRRKMNQIGM